MRNVRNKAGGRYVETPALSVDRSVAEIPDRWIGYADAAEASYETFKALRSEGVVPADMRFQVSVPTALAPVVMWVREEDQEHFYDAYLKALARDVDEICKVIPPDDLVLQVDIAVEIAALAGVVAAAGPLADKSVMVEGIRHLLARVPDGAIRGIHLCYGNAGGGHFVVPEDLALCVELTNLVADLAHFSHMPADRETGVNPSYFEPLRDLSPIQLALGLIDYAGDSKRTGELVQAAEAGSGGRTFAIATECGMARIDTSEGAPSLRRLLELHTEFAEAVR